MPSRTNAARTALVSLTLALAACSTPESLTPSVASPLPPAPVSTTEPPPAPEPPAPAVTEAPASPFSLVARFDDSASLTLAPLDGHAFLLVGTTVVDVEGDDLVLDAKKQSGLEKYQPPSMLGQLIAAGGVWPRSAWLATVEVLGRGGTSVLYRWERSRWVARGGGYGNSTLVGFSPWSKGRTLALVSEQMGANARFDVISGPRTPAPKPTRVKGRDAYPCSTRLFPSDFTALPSGEIFMLGTDCLAQKDNQTAWMVEHWAPGARTSTLTPLPNASSVGRIVALAPDEVYVAANEGEGESRPLLLRFDGSSWAPTAAPGEGKGELHHLSASPQGTLYALVDGAIWTRPRGGAWARVTLPALEGHAMAAAQLWVRSDGDLWALAAKTDPSGKVRRDALTANTLLHTRPPTRPFVMPEPPPPPDEAAGG